jgi:elongation factor Ts
MGVSIEAIKELRERTQAGMGDCKKALEEAGGDKEKAVEIILKAGKAKSAKRAGRVAAEGEVRAFVYDGGRRAAVVEVNIETDFAARNERFKTLVDRVEAAVVSGPETASLTDLTHDGRSLPELADQVTAVVGEKVGLRRLDRLAIGAGKHGFCHRYVHLGGKIGVIIAIEAPSTEAAAHPAAREFADDTAMQIAAMDPMALRRDQVSAATVSKQAEIFTEQLRQDPKPKPEKMWPKIVEGKVSKWFAEVVLLEQESAQHKKQIDVLRQEASKAAGGELTITAFVRYQLGEGIERRKEDITEGVADLLKG